MPKRTSIGKRKDNVSRELYRQIKAALFERATLNPPKVAAVLRQMHPAAETVFKDLYEVIIGRILSRETWGNLRCRFGISSAPVRDTMWSQTVTASGGTCFNSSQSVMRFRIGASLKSQIVTLKHGEGGRYLPYAVGEKRASIPTDLQLSEHASQR